MERFEVALVVSIGSVPMAVPHTRPVQLTNHATAHRLLVQSLARTGRHGEARRAFDRWTDAIVAANAQDPSTAPVAGLRAPVASVRTPWGVPAFFLTEVAPRPDQAQVDFADAGELSLFVDDDQLNLIRQVGKDGYLGNHHPIGFSYDDVAAIDLQIRNADSAVMGGAGSAVLEALQAAGVQTPVLTLGLPDVFIEHGDPAKLKPIYGI